MVELEMIGLKIDGLEVIRLDMTGSLTITNTY